MDILTEDYLRMFIFPFLLSIPHFIVIFIGLGVSVFRYKTYPRLSLFSIASLSTLAIINVISIFQPILNVWLIQSKIDTDTFTYLLGTISVLKTIFGAIALAVLIFAVWSKRENQ